MKNKSLVLALFSLMLVFAVAGCGSSGGDTSVTTTTTGAVTTTITVPAGFYSVSGSVYRGSLEAGSAGTIVVGLLGEFSESGFEHSSAFQSVTLESSSASVSYQLLLPATLEGYYWLAAVVIPSGEEGLRYIDVYGWDQASPPSAPSIEVAANLVGRDMRLFDISIW